MLAMSAPATALGALIIAAAPIARLTNRSGS
jgi:hypothetical protein